MVEIHTMDLSVSITLPIHSNSFSSSCHQILFPTCSTTSQTVTIFQRRYTLQLELSYSPFGWSICSLPSLLPHFRSLERKARLVHLLARMKKQTEPTVLMISNRHAQEGVL